MAEIALPLTLSRFKRVSRAHVNDSCHEKIFLITENQTGIRKFAIGKRMSLLNTAGVRHTSLAHLRHIDVVRGTIG